jgi:predicted permease
MASLFDDIRFSIRSLARAPGFALTAVVVLALAIGLNTAVFAVVNALLLKPLGGAAGGELVGLYLRDRTAPGQRSEAGGGFRRFTYPEYEALRRHPGLLSSILAQELTSVGVNDGQSSRRAFAALVSANYFRTLGVRPASGRDFRPDEERGATGLVAIVSDRFWRSLGAAGRLGGTVKINGHDVALVGVAPAGFSGATALFSPDFWLPLGACAATGAAAPNAAGCLESDERRTLALAGRLPAGSSHVAASAALVGVSAELSRRDTSAEITIGPLSRLSIGASPSGDSEVALVMVFLAGLSGCVLLIAGVNLANMLLARGSARRRELAVRAALGSGRWRILRLLITESALLASAGAAVGLALAVVATRLLAVAIAGALPFAIAFDATPDARVLSATLAFALLGGLACGLGPAVSLAREDTLRHLRDHAGRGRDGTRRASLRHALVVAQLAVSLALLTAAALFVRGAWSAARMDAGFSTDRQVVATVSPELSGYDEAAGRQAYQRVLSHLRNHPAVASASLASSIPFGMDAEARGVRDAGSARLEGSEVTLVSTIAAGYFRTLGVSVIRGREFDEREEQGTSGARVVVVNQVLASRLWPGADPLGQRLQLQRGDSQWDPPAEVVGLVPAIRQGPFDKQSPAQLYVASGTDYRAQAHLHVRLRSTGLDDSAGVRSVRAALGTADPSLALLAVDTMRGHQNRSIYSWIARASAALFASFGAAALLLAALGVYGVKAFLVAQRRREIAIRMALGASRRQVLAMVLRDGAALTSAGLVCGVLLAVALSRVLTAWVAGAGDFAWLPLTVASLVLASTATLACWLPVRRATAATPWRALKAD